MARSTSSAMSTAAATNWSSCCGTSATKSSAILPGAASARQRAGLRASRAGRKAVFVGDLVDRGPRILDTVRLVHNMVAAGHALCVPGNHDMKLMRKLRGRDVQVGARPGMQPRRDRRAARGGAHAVLRRGGRLPRCPDQPLRARRRQAGRRPRRHEGGDAGPRLGQGTRVRALGETTGETDEFGLPVRHNWAAEYRGRAHVVYGHTPVVEPEWLNRTINIDTGCVFGGRLTALRWPEKELISVPAARDLCRIGPAAPTGGAGADCPAAGGRRARYG